VSGWTKGIAEWRIGNSLYLSIPFTWLLPEARERARRHRGKTFAGGPAVDLMPDYLEGAATVGGECPVEPLLMHNPLATFTTKGCPRRCPFCAVPRIEGPFRELKAWRPAPIICDSNLLASSKRHFSKVIDSLKRFPSCDFNQGLDARLLKPFHADSLASLKAPVIRFSLDSVGCMASVSDAVSLCRKRGLNDIRIYCLIGYGDTPEDALHRLETVKSWDLFASPMRYQPLDCLERNSYVAEGWTERKLKDFMRYWSRRAWFRDLPFEDYNPSQERQGGLF
jgi:hypothetical protein